MKDIGTQNRLLMAHYQKISEYTFNCKTCPTRCDGKSKMNYQFQNDVAFSERYENRIIHWYNHYHEDIMAQKTNQDGYPDIEILDIYHQLIGLVEVKIQARTFMSVQRKLPRANLFPSETLTLNLSDLERYFNIVEKVNVPAYIVWGLMERPCVVPVNKLQYYHQNILTLKNIYKKELNKRRFRRKSGKGDIVNGQHKGVVVNYHFSLKELKKGLPEF